MSVRERSELKERVFKNLWKIFLPLVGVFGIVWVLIALGIQYFAGLSYFLKDLLLLTTVSHSVYLILGVALVVDWWREVTRGKPS